MHLRLRQRTLSFTRRPMVMGIVNINDDSFCGDGTLDISAALQMAKAMVAEGADFIDVGAESARTNRSPISVEEEIARLQPFVHAWHRWCAEVENQAAPWDADQVWPPLLSLNTWRPEVVAAVLPMGIDLLNDIGALPDDRNASLCAQHGTALLIMHSVGRPKIAHTHVSYPDVWEELRTFFAEKIKLATAAGVSADRIVLDPGIDFAKQREDNLAVFAGLDRLQSFGRPVLLPISRKSVIGQVLGLPNPNDRDAGTIACMISGLGRGAQLFRVHNVRAAAQALKVAWAVDNAGDQG